MTYFKNIQIAISTSVSGLRLSLAHFFQVFKKKREQDITADSYFSEDKGTVTVQFPHESIPIPDNGRYKLHNEMDDCIVCDKCAKVCPVNCIDIVPIRSPETFGETSDGTPLRIYAETFDIDMSKCMFCGLCTTVCPTECLTMTPDFDYSTYDIRDHVFPFGNMTDETVVEKKADWEKHQTQKMASPQASSMASTPKPKPVVGGRPVFIPKVIPKTQKKESETPKSKPVMGGKPILKPKPVAGGKPVFKPRIMPKRNIKGSETPKLDD